MSVEDSPFYRELLGSWEIRYPGPDGEIYPDYSESLELRADGTFAWSPAPLWVKPGGRWRFERCAETQQFELHFEERRGHRFRGEWLILSTFIAPTCRELRIQWQRSVSGAVDFNDRIFTGRRIRAAPTAGTTRYPYLAVRIFAGIYQREQIQIYAGPPSLEVVHRRCVLQHPAPYDADGGISAACRALAIVGVGDAVRKLGMQICIVWGESSCTYIQTDSITEHSEPPTGGALAEQMVFKPQYYKPFETVSDGVPEYE